MHSSSKENMQGNSSRINIPEEQNMQKMETRDLQSYPPVSCTYSDLKKWEIFYFVDKEFVSQIYIIMAFENDSALIMTKDKMVYSLGVSYNQLQLNKDYVEPEKIKALCGKNIKTFYCSTDAECIFALTEEGEVYSWGFNWDSRLGRELNEESHKIYIPAKMDILRKERIIDIASNRFVSLVLTDSGKVYIWGDAQFGCGAGRYNLLLHQVKFEVETEKIVRIACGWSFIMTLDDNGKLYSWGRNENGQLGINSEDREKQQPCLITSLSDVTIVKVVCGFDHSLALSDEGKIYSWGSNDQGQLGHGRKTRQEIKPVMLNVPVGKISDIAAQNNKSVAIDMKIGRVYVWGHHVHCQTIWVPVKTEYSTIYDVLRYKICYIIHDSIKEKLNILEYLAAAFNDMTTSDLTIKIGGQFIYVHKAILKIRCQYFRNMFQNDCAANNQSIIEHEQFSYNVYKTFLKYLYTDVVDQLPIEETLELLKLCDEYNETELERKCNEIIRENITRQT